jgi:ABC-2 type transport system permease protein
MTAWRLEWLRMVRSPRGIVLACVYLFFGLVGPLMAKYLPEIAKLASSGVKIIAPAPKPADGLVNYVDQASQTGLVVLVVVVAGALAFDAHRGLAVFYRTRVPGPFALIWPRFVVGAAAGVVAYVLGTGVAWYETTLVLGGLPADQVLLGVACEAVFVVFAVAVVALAATVGRSALATVGIAVGVLLVALPLAGVVPALHPWLPSTLMTAPAGLLTTTAIDGYLESIAVTLLATVALLALAVRRSRRREV